MRFRWQPGRGGTRWGNIECTKILPTIPKHFKPFITQAATLSCAWRTSARSGGPGRSSGPAWTWCWAHEGPLGLKPWSISTSALDVDAGDPGELMQAWPPMAILDSRRSDGKHLYYSDTEGRANGHFEVYGCAGEIRSARGYLILWHDGAGRLADTLHDPIARSRRWPRDLFELAGLPAVTFPGAVKTPTYRYKPSDQSRQTWAVAAAGLELETIKRGVRNVKLFDAIRFWAYSVPRGQDLNAWTRRGPDPRPGAKPPLP